MYFFRKEETVWTVSAGKAELNSSTTFAQVSFFLLKTLEWKHYDFMNFRKGHTIVYKQ